MKDKKLLEELARLRAELDEAIRENSDARDKLNSLIKDIEQAVFQPDQSDADKDLLGDIKGAIEKFETEHPRATAILNDIMVTLSNMGI